MKTALIVTISALLLWSFGAGRHDNSNPEFSCHPATLQEGEPRPPPYLVAVELWPPSGGCIHRCTATIDTADTVLTTSSCVAVPEMYFKYLKIVAGPSGGEEKLQVRSITGISLHPFSDPSNQNISFNTATVHINGSWGHFYHGTPGSIDEIGGPENMVCKYIGWDMINPKSEIVSYFEKEGRYIGDENCKEAIKGVIPSERNLIRQCFKEIGPDSEEINHKSFYAHGGPLICKPQNTDFVVGLASFPNLTSNGNYTGLPIFTEGLRQKYP